MLALVAYLAAWLLVAIVVALVLGRAMVKRDRQVPR